VDGPADLWRHPMSVLLSPPLTDAAARPPAAVSAGTVRGVPTGLLRQGLWPLLGRGLPVLLLVLALLGAPVWLGRQALLHHRAERQAEAVQALAHGLATLPGDLGARLQALPAWQGAPSAEVRVSDEQGRLLAQWQGWRLPVMAPAGFVDALRLPSTPAQARVPVLGRQLRLDVRVGVADLLDLLWQASCASAAALLALWLAGLAWWHRRSAQLTAVQQLATDRLLARQQTLFDQQAEQLEQLRQQAHSDGLTGLHNRRHFLAALDQWLAGQGDAPQGGLVLLRLQDLDGMNQRLGHAITDRVLQALAQLLGAYPQRIPHCAAGRLNGADFALLLPAPGLAADTAHSLMLALKTAIDRIDPRASVAAGALEISQRALAAQVLAAADAALAEAELAGHYTVASAGATAALVDAAGQPVGELAWQRRIERALALNHVALGAYPVCTADGRALHLDCPLRVRFEPGGPLQPAQRWLALAVRSRLSAQVDEKALTLALAAIAQDGVGRCINMSAASVASPEFVASVSRRLEQSPDAACRLWIDLPESLALERPMLVRELSRRWRPLGAMLALEHAGDGLMRITRLIDLGLDCVRIDGRFVNGVAQPDAADARRYLQGLVRLVQSVGLQVSAEGVRAVADLEALWALGFDAATGPAVGAAWAPAAPPRPPAAGGTDPVAAAPPTAQRRERQDEAVAV
jgi:diguanylate cyclase (GGDEF)-like protein